MKRLLKKTNGLMKGTSSAVLISMAVHAGLLLLAGGLVVFTVIKKDEKKFVPPPPVERPKMELKKPQVKVKKTSPPPAARHIVSKTVQAMPDLQLPDVSGISGSGLGGGLDGFDLVPDVSDMGLFGGGKSISVGNDFEGTFYSLAYDRSRKKTNINDGNYRKIIRRFVDSGWNPYVFSPYYRAPQTLYTTQIFIPEISSEFGPSHFGIPAGPDFDPYLWCVHYKGKIKRKEGGTYRFAGFGDDVLLVRVNGKLVFDGSHPEHRSELTGWKRHDDDYKYFLGTSSAAYGDWFELEPDVPVDMEVLIGEIPGGMFSAYLMVEQKGDFYSRNRDDMPILPVFKTADIPDAVKDKIKYSLIPGEADLDSDLMFNVY